MPSVKAPIDSATEALINRLIEGLMAVPESSLTVVGETEEPCSRSLDIPNRQDEAAGCRRSQTRRMNTNEQDTYISVCKLLNPLHTKEGRGYFT